MVGQGEGRGADGDLLSDSGSKPALGQDFLENGVKLCAVTAEIVFEELDLDVSLVRSLDPSRVGTEDWLGVTVGS